jgi:hypothetical protein
MKVFKPMLRLIAYAPEEIILIRPVGVAKRQRFTPIIDQGSAKIFLPNIKQVRLAEGRFVDNNPMILPASAGYWVIKRPNVYPAVLCVKFSNRRS